MLAGLTALGGACGGQEYEVPNDDCGMNVGFEGVGVLRRGETVVLEEP